MANREVVVTHPSQLNALRVFPLRGRRVVGSLRLGGAIAEHPERARWETQLNRHYYACGCDTGAAGVIVGLLAGIAAGAYGRMLGGWSWGAAAGLAVALVGAGGVIGKLGGLARAERRFRDTVREIQRSWKEPESDAPDRWLCG